MGSVVDSLKRLYRKIGGGKIKGPIAVDDLVDKIADQMSSGSLDGGGGVEIIEFVDKEIGSSTYKAPNITYNQLKGLLESGKSPVFCDVYEDDQSGERYTRTRYIAFNYVEEQINNEYYSYSLELSDNNNQGYASFVAVDPDEIFEPYMD